MGLGELKGPVDVWMHAASVGEVKVLGNLIRYLQKRRNNISIHLTTVTATGYRAACEAFGECVGVSFFPLDATPSVGRTLSKLQPRLIAVAETEIWPNLIRLAARDRLPMVLVNGRMSESSIAKYNLFRGAIRDLLGTYDRFFFKTQADRDRYARFGVSDTRSEVTGDMKFDSPLRPREADRVDEIRKAVGLDHEDFLFMAGSTRPGEEALLIDTYQQLSGRYPHFRLGLAPRHLDRLGEVREMLSSRGMDCRDYESEKECRQVLLVDRMGILSDLYQAADLAFVGGSLVDIGGHNLLEPVWEQVPVLYGPYLDNVIDAAEYIEAHRFGARVNSVEELTAMVEAVLAGRLRFRIKEETDISGSATARVGDYLLERLGYV
jgi:3-deoxy-D-manno-octulosonic-acid transferase